MSAERIDATAEPIDASAERIDAAAEPNDGTAEPIDVTAEHDTARRSLSCPRRRPPHARPHASAAVRVA